ncbi:Voltage-dependent L-type calcium channel subunit alpha-1C [Durusdinium trenchii]|uniref:Voltage-dependent L-type calcium channel subunit alpha-1C n=1 Tax=Durusdinium trenchii TaxID=1381693 RepID=A0ABP0M504_9DINO
MFTAFRCFNGECVTEHGHAIPFMLSERFGLPFQLAYVASYMLVTMGIFNVILAVYVDITMRAAKENDVQTAEAYSRESIRIARTTRELLKRFEENGTPAHKGSLRKLPSAALLTEDLMTDINISKELFLLVIQDKKIQRLMDELDLPPDRANLPHD